MKYLGPFQAQPQQRRVAVYIVAIIALVVLSAGITLALSHTVLWESEEEFHFVGATPTPAATSTVTPTSEPSRQGPASAPGSATSTPEASPTPASTPVPTATPQPINTATPEPPEFAINHVDRTNAQGVPAGDTAELSVHYVADFEPGCTYRAHDSYEVWCYVEHDDTAGEGVATFYGRTGPGTEDFVLEVYMALTYTPEDTL